MADFILTIHLFKEGRTTAQFFETLESAEEHGRLMQATFPCDTYVSEVKSKTYGTRKESA